MRASEWWVIDIKSHDKAVAALRRALELAHGLDERRESADLDRARHGVSHELETALGYLDVETVPRIVRMVQVSDYFPDGDGTGV